MTFQNKLLIQPLNPNHNRKDFNCGVINLNNYIQKQARLDVKRWISRVFVATTPNDPSSILGYYTLSSSAICPDDLPARLVQKLPNYPVPAVLLGRLAVAKNVQGQGIGRSLLTNALIRTLAISDEIGIYALIIDALDDRAKSFYETFGFLQLSTGSRRLFLPLQSTSTMSLF